MTMKKLTKSSNKSISGVCGGIAEYFNLDPTLVRVIYLSLCLLPISFPGLLVYIILAMVMPKAEENSIIINNQ